MVELEGSKRKRAAKNNRDNECSDRSMEVKLLAPFGNYDKPNQLTD